MDIAHPTPLLDGERIILKPVTLEFCTEKYLSWLNDAEVNVHLVTKENYSMEDLHHFVKKNICDDIFFWAIFVKENNCHIGNIKIDKINRVKLDGEYGIMIGDKSEWGKGYGEEASKMVINYCFRKLGLRSINLGVDRNNLSAVKLYKKLGFEITTNESLVADDSDNYYRMTILNTN